MLDAECVALLQWALPRMHLRWGAYRKVRRQICKRIARRMQELGVGEPAAYKLFLQNNPEEWHCLAAMCRVTISRFNRDKAVFQTLGSTVLPHLARRSASRGYRPLTIWSAGSASGEEPYTVALLWYFGPAAHFPDGRLLVLATDAQSGLLRRATRARYPGSALRDIPREWWIAFDRQGSEFHLRPEFRAPVHFAAHDLHTGAPGGPFDVVLCRNLAFTYWDDSLQRRALHEIDRSLKPGGVLVLGAHEALPYDAGYRVPWPAASCVFRKPQLGSTIFPMNKMVPE
jgi:chemotaxis protein methyltransferase CheR